jgi:hypothetical protein
VIAEKVKETKKSLTLKISNPTKADAAVKVLVENDDDLKKPLGHNYFPDLKTIKIKAGGEKVLTFKK